MKKVIVVSDSFKGTLSSEDIASVCLETAQERKWPIEFSCYPIADGGEGTIEAFHKCIGGQIINIETVDANGNPIEASYLLNEDTAIVEVSSCVYLPTTHIKNPLITSSYGVGLLIKDAITRGAKKIIVGLGGSSTNDAGAPIAKALGARFYDEDDNEIELLSGGFLDEVKRIDLSLLQETIGKVEFVGMCDVKNPLCGINGASYVYGPQKGADEEMVKILDKNLLRYGEIVSSALGADRSNEEGAGAAGGIGFGIVSLLGGRLISGIDVLLDAIDFESKIKECDLVISGEGRLDSQSFSGKVIDGVSRRVLKEGKELALIVGCLGKDLNKEEVAKRGIQRLEICSNGEVDFEEIKKNAKKNYQDALIRLIEKR